MTHKKIEFRQIRYLRGPNIWTYRPVLEALVDIGDLEDFPSNKLPGFPQRLSAWLPSLVEHRCSYGERGGFLKRLEEGTWPAHILEHVTLELQNLAGLPGGFGKAREISERGVYKVIVRAWSEPVTRAALMYARDLVMAAIENKPFDLEFCIESLKEISDAHCLGPSTACIVDAADDRSIPYIRLTEGNLVQLGYGSQQRRIWTAETDTTSAIAESISRDKSLTKELLHACGVPVPQGWEVDGLEEVWEAARDIGFPVVLKPSDGNHGRGVFTNITTEKELEAAYQIAQQEGSSVMVEKFIQGDEHRLLVVGEQVVAAARGESAWIKGDGQSTVRELVNQQLNTDPRRGYFEEHPLNPVRFDSGTLMELGRQNLTPESIPEAGRPVLIQRNGNVSIDVTDKVHPELARTVVLAARIVGLDIAGVDLVARDIAQPLEAQEGAIVEVNAGPGLLMHLKPGEGTPRPVGEAIVNLLFPNESTGRIPIVGISGGNTQGNPGGQSAIARLLAHFLGLNGVYTGLACRDGVFLNHRPIENPAMFAADPWTSTQRLLMNRQVQVAVIENSPEYLLSHGLAYDRCQVGIVTDTRSDPSFKSRLAAFHIETPEQVFNVLRTQVDVVLPTGIAVLNAADEQASVLAELCDGEVLFFAQEDTLPLLAQHCVEGGRAMFLRSGQLIFCYRGAEEPILDLDAVLQKGITMPLDDLLAAIGGAWALGVGPDIIRAGLETFSF